MNLALPLPRLERWQPLRSGLINLFKYDNETFHFTNGRLLLRGSNGAGKSRVLALQLPFLLDGEIVPSRVEPDGAPEKRMEWHLLMNNKHSHRLGYTWIEFGRRTVDGKIEFCTLGCGMEMNKGGKFHRWLFITPLRVGDSLKLVRDGGYPLTRDGLEGALTAGAIYPTVREYRFAVDDHMFHLKEERYNALVNLLIQLRKPQLSRDLDEKVLSKALSDSLPPLDSSTLNDCSEAFRELEDDKAELKDFERSSKALNEFHKSYQRYAGIAVGRNATALRDAHNAYEREQRASRRCEDELAAAKSKWSGTETEVAKSKLKKEEAQGEVDALRDSPEMKTVADLERRAEDAKREEGNAATAAHDYELAKTVVSDREKQLQQIDENLSHDRRRLNGYIENLRSAETPLGISTSLEDAEANAGKIEGSKRKAAVETQRLREQHAYLSKLSKAVVDAQSALKRAEEFRNNQEGRVDRARVDEADRRTDHKDTVEKLLASTRNWINRAEILRIVDAEVRVDELKRWCDVVIGISPVRAVAGVARSRIESEIGQREGEIKAHRKGIDGKRRGLLEEKEKRLKGIETGPPPPLHIDPALRENRDGAPFWKVCDFQDHLTHSDRANCEAALQAAGLLDAWITPEGKLVSQDKGVFIDCRDSRELPERNLGHALRVTINTLDSHSATLSESVIERVLCSIGLERAGDVWIGVDGSWHNGLLTGHWIKHSAEFIGAAAREAARQRRLIEIDGELADLLASENILRAEEELLKARRDKANNEFTSLPEENAVREALTKWGVASAATEREHKEYERLSAIALVRQQTYEAASQAFVSHTRELKLESWMEKLDELKDAIESLDRRFGELWPAFDIFHRSKLAHKQTQTELERAQEKAADHKERSNRAANFAARLRKEYETLETVAGPKAREIAGLFATAKVKLAEMESDLKRREKENKDAEIAHEKLLERVAALTEKLNAAELERGRHISAFRTFASTGLLEQLGESPEGIESWSPTRLVEYVREVHARVGAEALSDEAWDRTQNSLHQDFEALKKELSAQRKYSLRPESESRHGVDVIGVEYDGKLRRIPDVLGRINEEVAQRSNLLRAEEREFIENHLIGEIADHLHKLICQAAELVNAMTTEVVKRPTFAAGMMLRFKWEPREDGPPDTRSVCELLKRAKSTWSEPEKDKLAAFLQERIQEIRNSPDFGTWRECLERAVDYREWHIFFVEQKLDADWRRLTKRTHGTGSSGEKAVALTIPQFAAAAAHYHSAPTAPRLILLDEVFVGIDPHMRAHCMGLLESFDLDFVMTSENEWGCYPTISGLSICQLATRAGLNAIAVTPWIWNGKARSRATYALPAGAQIGNANVATTNGAQAHL